VNGQSVRNRVISGVFWLAATKALGQAITWGITIVVVRLLSPQDYGLMGIATLLIGMLLLFNELGLGAAVIQKGNLNTDHLPDLRWAILGVNLSLCLGLVLCAPLVAAYFSEPAVTPLIRALSVIFVIQGIGAPSACMLQREMKFRQKSQAELFGNVAGSLMTLTCALAGLGVWSLVTGYLMLQVTTHTLYCLYHPVPFTWKFSPGNVRPFVHFGFHVTSARVLYYASSNADFVVVGRVLGAVQLGYYGLAFQLSALPTDKILSIVTQVAYPSFSALQKDDATLKRYFLKLIGVVALVTFPMFLGLFLVAERGIPLVLTSQWAAVIVPLQILCFVACFRAIGTINTPLFMAKGRADLFLFNNILQIILLPIAFYVGARNGLVGVSMAWLIVGPILFTIMTGQALRLLDLTAMEYAGALKHAAIGSAVMVGIVMAVQRLLLAETRPAYHLIATCVIGALLYAGYQVLFNRDALSEIRGTLKFATPAVGRDVAAAQPSTPSGASLGIPVHSTPDALSIGVKAD
jgi:O-antigen/teichoic acid export membrane protein